MMKVRCPKCQRAIAQSDINVASDVAMCRTCGEAFKLSDTVALSEDDKFDLSTPPPGAWFEQRYNGFRVGATTRSWGAWFTVPFTAAWAGGSMFAIYGTQLENGTFDPASALFGLPFVIGSIVLVTLSALKVAGHVTVTVENDKGAIFTGVGPIGWSRHFVWSDVSSIDEEADRFRWHGPGIYNDVIALKGRTRVAFGNLISPARKYFILQALKRMRFAR